MKYSIPNLDARYTLQPQNIAFLEQWLAFFEGSLLGIYSTRKEAEENCRWHNAEMMCAEEMI